MEEHERRSVYRVPYRGIAGQKLGVVLERGDGGRFEAQIVDLSIKGMGARFDGEGAPALAKRERVTLEISLPELDVALKIPAIVRSAVVKPDMCRAGFEFRGGAFPGTGLASRVYGWFNRRSSPRAVAGRSVAAWIARPKDEPIEGSMVDVSSGGITIAVARSEGRTLREGETRTVLIDLGDDAAPAALDAKIQRRETNGSSLTVGFEFQPPFEAEAKERVDRFVLERLLAQG